MAPPAPSHYGRGRTSAGRVAGQAQRTARAIEFEFAVAADRQGELVGAMAEGESGDDRHSRAKTLAQRRDHGIKIKAVVIGRGLLGREIADQYGTLALQHAGMQQLHRARLPPQSVPSVAQRGPAAGNDT